MYDLVLSSYSINAMRAVLIGSYSMRITEAGISNFVLLKSITLNFFLCPPPRWREVILPELFLPAFEVYFLVKDFSDAPFHK